MAYGTTTPPASARDTDAPIIVVQNALDYSGGLHNGIWSATKDLGGTDATLAGFPIERAYDGLWHVYTKPSSDAATWYCVFYADPTVPIDYVGILGHNFADAPSGFSWELGTADDDTFATNAVVMASENSGITSKRRTKLMSSRYTNVERVYLKVTASAPWRPRIGEIILGARSQMAFKPRRPYDPRALRADTVEATSPGGISTVAVRSKGRRVAPLQFTVNGSTERDLMRAIYVDSSYGTRNAVLLDFPTSEPERAYVVRLPQEFQIPNVEGPHQFECALDLEECGPFYEVE